MSVPAPPSTDVLIAGGGPIGLTLAHALAHWGVGCILAERNEGTTRHPKMDITNSRSMELFSRLGLSQLVRDTGCPLDSNFDVAWVTRPAGHALHRFRYPSQTEMWRKIRAGNDGSMPAEPAVRISQIVLEPAFKAALSRRPQADVRFGWALEDLQQDADGVTASLRRPGASTTQQVRARYLVGCDGGGSTVRQLLGIALAGTAGVRASLMVHFRSRAYEVLQRWGVVWHIQNGRGTIICQDDHEYWTLQMRLLEGDDPARLDPLATLHRHVGRPFEAEVLQSNAWKAHLLVADRYRHGRVFLAGDSAHQFVPTGGYGMNTGVGDALDLAWKLAAVLQGWGGETLLESYEAERRPIALHNREAARANLQVRFRIADIYAAAGDLEDESPQAAERRAMLATQIAAIGNAENEQWGTEYGYRYDASPVIAHEAGEAPRFDPLIYRPTTWPGMRLPSLVLEDGRSIFERLGKGFTLLTFGAAAVGDVAAVAAQLGVPLDVVPIGGDQRRAIYQRRLLLVRPDHHIAWRGDQPPADWRRLLQLVTGQLDGDQH